MKAHFKGEVITKWLVDNKETDHLMQLMEDFIFVDKDGFEWKAPKGITIDGASIPRLLWVAVGSPFVGDYRRASVLHDYECYMQNKPHRKVHKMFYHAMRCDGVSRFKAGYMYVAVRIGGGAWGDGSFFPSAFKENMPKGLSRDERKNMKLFSVDDIYNYAESFDSIDELEERIDSLLLK